MAFGSNQFPLKIPVEAVDRFSLPLGRISGALSGFGRKAEQVGRKLTIGLTVPLSAFGLASVRTGLEFQRALNRVQVVTGGTADEVAALQERVEGALGERGIPTTARESAAAMFELARSGQSLAEIEQTLPGVIALATAAAEDQATTAKLTSDVLDAYGLSAEKAVEVTDLLALASARGQQELSPLAEGVTAAAAAATTFDQDLASAVATLDLLADKGKEGTAGAQAFGTTLAALRRPSTQALKVLSSLGITAEDLSTKAADGAVRMRPLEEILGNLRERGLTSGQALAIFGRKAGPLAFQLVKDADRVNVFADALRAAGTRAEDLAKVQLGGGIQPLEEFRQKWERLLVTVARSGLLEGLAALAEQAGKVFAWVSKLDPAILRWSIRLGAVAAIAGPALIFVGQLATGLGALAKIGSLVGLAGLGRSLAGIVGKAAPWAALAIAVGSITSDVLRLLDAIKGTGAEAAGGPKIDRPAVDQFQFQPGPAAGPGRVRAVGAGGRAAAAGAARADVSGRIQVELQNLPPGTRVRSRQSGDIPMDVEAGYNLAAGLAG